LTKNTRDKTIKKRKKEKEPTGTAGKPQILAKNNAVLLKKKKAGKR